MRKFRSTLLFLLAFSLVLSLASCIKVDNGDSSTDETTEAPAPEVNYTADELFTMIDEKMNSLDSYESALEMVMNVTIYGVEVNTTATGIDIRTGLATDNFEFFTESETTVSSPSLSSPQKATTVEAYYGGNYFISNRGDGMDQKFYSPMTKEDAQARADEEELDFLMLGDCVNKELVKNEDGTYDLAFSGYTAKTVSEILKHTGLDTMSLTHDIVDVKLNIKVNADFSVAVLEIEFEFEQKDGGEKVPVISVKTTYSKYNEAVINTQPITPSKYKEVDDIRILEEVTELLSQRWLKEEGNFTLTIDQSLKFMGDSQTSHETDTVVYGSNADGYFYEIAADMDGTKYDISYTKGVQTVTVDGQTQQAAQTEAEARTFIESLMNSAQFDGVSITDMKKTSDNQYVLTCKPTAAYKSLIEQMGATFRSVTQTITVTVENGEVVRIESEANAKGAVTSGNSTYELTFTVVSNVKFDK